MKTHANYNPVSLSLTQYTMIYYDKIIALFLSLSLSLTLTLSLSLSLSLTHYLIYV